MESESKKLENCFYGNSMLESLRRYDVDDYEIIKWLQNDKRDEECTYSIPLKTKVLQNEPLSVHSKTQN